MTKKLSYIILTLLLVSLQFKLWFSAGGYLDVYRIKQQVLSQQQINSRMQKENAALMANIADLKSGNTAVEELARTELSMIKVDEVYYHFISNLQ